MQLFLEIKNQTCVVKMNCNDFFKKLQDMNDEDIQNKVYIVMEDTTLEVLKSFCIFIYSNFMKYGHYEMMLPTRTTVWNC